MSSADLLVALFVKIAVASVTTCAPVFARDVPSYEELSSYIQEKGIAKNIEINEYYDPTEESERHLSVKREVHRRIQFPDRCVMEIVNDHFQEVAPPTSSGAGNNYGLMERETLTVALDRLIPSQIYESERPPDGTAVIIKSKGGGISSRTEKFFDQAGNRNLYGLAMRDAALGSLDSPFGRLECAGEVCTRSRAFNGYGVTPSENRYAGGLRDALVGITRICGGTG